MSCTGTATSLLLLFGPIDDETIPLRFCGDRCFLLRIASDTNTLYFSASTLTVFSEHAVDDARTSTQFIQLVVFYVMDVA